MPQTKLRRMSSQTTMVNGSQSGTYDRQLDVKTFDEEKTGVKGLVDAGLPKIPSIFVRPHEELSEDLDICQDKLAVPIVDLTHVHHTSIEREEIIRSIISALETWGFFQVVNHGIPLEIMRNVIEGVKMFHEQDAEVKKELYSRDTSRPVRFNSNRDLYHSTAANWRDSLYVDNHVFKSELGPELLPPICRDAIMGYVKHVNKLGDLLFELISMGLGVEPDHLGEMDCAKSLALIGHYYPACPEPDLTLGASMHTDPAFLTVVLQDQIGGLQVLHRKKWVTVDPVPGALIVNIGDILQMVSNDKLKSVYHRVTANTVGPRISIATFFTGLLSSSIKYGPIKELVSKENPPSYREFTIQEYLSQFFNRPLGQPATAYFRRNM